MRIDVVTQLGDVRLGWTPRWGMHLMFGRARIPIETEEMFRELVAGLEGMLVKWEDWIDGKILDGELDLWVPRTL